MEVNLPDVNNTKKDLPHKARFVIRLAALGAALFFL